MKILHIETGRYLYGGALQVCYLLEGLQAHGVENHLACVADSAIAAAAKAHCKAVHALPMRYGELDLRFYWQLKTLIHRIQPTLLHVHSRRGADIWGGLAAKSGRIPAVLSRRVDNPEPALIGHLKYRLFQRVITISSGIYQVLLQAGVAPEKLVCVPSAVAFDAYQTPCNRDWFTTAFGLPKTAKVIAVIAQFIARKGHRYLFEALPAILHHHPDTFVLLLGKGPLETHLKAEVKHANLAEHVIFAGFREDLPTLLPCLDLVVHPALMEGLGVSLLQAASAGVPIVASRVGGLPEVLAADNGILIPPAQSKALADAVIELLGDATRRRHMAERGRTYMRQQFSVSSMVQGNYAVYQQLLGRYA